MQQNKMPRPPKQPLMARLRQKAAEWLEIQAEKKEQAAVVRAREAAEEAAREKTIPVFVQGSIDYWFLVLVLVMLAFGAVVSYTASAVYAETRYDDSTYFLRKYLLYTVLSLAVTFPFVAYAKLWFWRVFGAAAYLGSIFLLLLVLVIGVAQGDAQRWLKFGSITIQPSEIAKMAVVMMLALYMTKHEKEITSTMAYGGSFRYGVVRPGILFGVICLLVAAEHHISGLLIIAMISVVVMYMGGTRIKYLLMIGGAVACLGVLMVFVSSYAQNRIDIWLHLEDLDPRGIAWQTLEGLYAIGSGGLFGRGLGNSQMKYGYISQPQNDYVFTVICEELGFVGAMMVVALFVLLVLRGFHIAKSAPDKYSALVVYGLTFKVALQAALNIAVVTNSMPNTGISLPFFSSGGTSLAVQIFEMGIILSISRYSAVKS